jgi:hypothetical protein
LESRRTRSSFRYNRHISIHDLDLQELSFHSLDFLPVAKVSLAGSSHKEDFLDIWVGIDIAPIFQAISSLHWRTLQSAQYPMRIVFKDNPFKLSCIAFTISTCFDRAPERKNVMNPRCLKKEL